MMADSHKAELCIAELEESYKHVSDVHSETLKPSKPAHEHIEGNALLVDEAGNVRRLPIPSNNPNDPLNYKAWKKAAIIACCCCFCTSVPRSPSLLTSDRLLTGEPLS